ncbi:MULTISPECIES: hypothetical protein [unclassified Microbacterium]|uniref:hypothetical protein n=1 Tax=unclassified Microbacterium TaxID=2609290 RepID=UPI00214B140B|nr:MULTISPECIES: hypothetical protein [unclassified Microbacterium]MCR2786103.1 hypothetical protein [Microbacterium sp. zg.B96]MCR2786121.1 hypothetical protein [Microbacterium sp. zg.B96]WIM17040.1 hypothetical protein QNO11_05235 [Microbacterium sp. zg-B96]WIM17048.1 hypothetical protein QNO11_05275 [Microbacterium sp. zg-B96]
MTAQPVVEKNPLMKRPRPISRGTVLAVGVILIPMALTVAFNSYGALTVDGALRMAFATVAGQTIAILSAITALVLTVKRRYAWPTTVAFAIITALVTMWAFGSIASAGESLLNRFDVIADVNQLNT